MKHFLQLFFGITLIAFFSLEVNSQEETILISPEKDNSIFQVTEEFSNGMGPEIYTGTINLGLRWIRRGLIQFNFSDIPEGSTITEVSLEMYCTKASASGTDMNYNLHRLEKSWGESSSNASNGQGTPAEPGDATWIFRFFDEVSPILWIDDGGEFVASSSATLAVNDANAYYTWTSNQLKDDVQDMLDNPDLNFGWIIRADDETIQGLGRAFASRENPDEDLRPVLTVSYIDVSAVNNASQSEMYYVYPNPGKDKITIVHNSTALDRKYQIIDVSGRIVEEGKLATRSEIINTASLDAGCYFVRFPNSSMTTIKWVKD